MLDAIVHIVGMLVLPPLIIAAFITNNDTLMLITLILLIVVILYVIGITAKIFLGSLANDMARVTSWRYIKDAKYGGYAIQARRELLGRTWWTSEYLSGCEEEAKRLIKLKQGLQ